jgi:hypothetical protein
MPDGDRCAAVSFGDQARSVARIRAGGWLGTLTLLVGLAWLVAPAQPAAAYGTDCASAVVKPVVPFHIASDNRTIVDANGRTFISYGTTVPGLSDPNLTTYLSTDLQKIDATANVWCGNTVRLQVSQYAVTHNTTPDDSGTCQVFPAAELIDIPACGPGGCVEPRWSRDHPGLVSDLG